jgi:hypothetical protein
MNPRLERRLRRVLVLLGIVALAGVIDQGATATTTSLAGSQGTDTAIPPTNSAVTVHGRGAFANLAITVNQTQNLTNQAISITWTGGAPTISSPGRFSGNYLQIMQCWGDDDGTNPQNPGPPPEQCEQGAVAGIYGGLPGSIYPPGFALSRLISRSTWSNYDPNVGVLDQATTNVWLPFRAVDGTTVPIQTDANFNPSVQGGNFWLNPYYNIITTNEIAGSATGPDGRGADLFQVLNGVESAGLGCGQRVEPVAGGGTKVPNCGLVIVPRGTPAQENVGTPFEDNADQLGVATSPVSPAAWANRIAIPLGFNPVDSPCNLGADNRRISGSQLALAAVSSWQPTLCTLHPNDPPYAYAPVSDSEARQQLVSGTPGAPGMVLVSRPLTGDQVTAQNPIVYAPIAVSGITIGFNIERLPKYDAPSDEQQLSGVRIAELNLTPRLVAKLLTQSYRQAVNIIQQPPYSWLSTNPATLGSDPDFLKFNPEFQQLDVGYPREFSSLQLPEGNSDAARAVWQWILGDPEAKAWLDGQPDPWGMKVNPAYATSASLNPNHVAFGSPLPEFFPKSDPYCYQGPNLGTARDIVPPLLCGTDWVPYSRDLQSTAQVARSGFDGAKIGANPFAVSTSDVWKAGTPQYIGQRSVLSLTDTPSANQFGLQTARLSRAGDDNDSRQFVAADTAGLTAGIGAMGGLENPGVLEPNPANHTTGAYPLTLVTYAAAAPAGMDASARTQYANFVKYAVGDGQTPGLNLGELPRGYAPLSAALKTQALTTAQKILTLQAPPTTTPSGGGTPVTSPPTSAPVTTEAATTTTVAPTTTEVTTTAAPTTTVVAFQPPVTEVVARPTQTKMAVPVVALIAILAALGALEVTKRPRRHWPTGAEPEDAP